MPHSWSHEQDKLLWRNKTQPITAIVSDRRLGCNIQGCMKDGGCNGYRTTEAIFSRLGHLNDPTYKAYKRLNGIQEVVESSYQQELEKRTRVPHHPFHVMRAFMVNGIKYSNTIAQDQEKRQQEEERRTMPPTPFVMPLVMPRAFSVNGIKYNTTSAHPQEEEKRQQEQEKRQQELEKRQKEQEKRKLPYEQAQKEEKANKKARIKEKATTACHKCKLITDNWSSDNAECVDCGEDFGCTDCWADAGSFCGSCNEFHCDDCGRSPLACDFCLNLFCDECADFKPGKDGVNQCSNCQPWWQKNKPASDFCRDCGSSRQGASICEGCSSRVCDHCCGGMTCEECGEFYCDTCDGDFCTKCCEDDRTVCGECCEDHGDGDEDEED